MSTHGSLSVTDRPIRPRSVYLSYDGALEPLGASQVVPYVKGLGVRGADITLVSFEKPIDWKDSMRVHALRAELAACGVRWVPLRYHKLPPVLATVYDVVRGLVCVGGRVRRERIPLIHARSYVAALMAWLLKRGGGVRVIFDMRGFWADERVEGGLWAPKGVPYRLAKRLERLFLEEADEIVTLTECARQTVQAWLGDRCPPVTVIPTCVDLEHFPRASMGRSSPTRPRFVYAGSVGTWYAFSEVLRFMERALKRFSDAQLLIFTRQTEEAARLLRRSAVPSTHVVITTVEAAQIPRRLAQAHAGLAFYKPGFSRRGTCPTKLGEYLATGLPVVTNRWIGDVETHLGAEQVGVLLSDFSAEAYDRALETLEQMWVDPTLAARCRQVAERLFSLSSGIERYWALYARLMARATREATGQPCAIREHEPVSQAAG